MSQKIKNEEPDENEKIHKMIQRVSEEYQIDPADMVDEIYEALEPKDKLLVDISRIQGHNEATEKISLEIADRLGISKSSVSSVEAERVKNGV